MTEKTQTTQGKEINQMSKDEATSKEQSTPKIKDNEKPGVEQPTSKKPEQSPQMRDNKKVKPLPKEPLKEEPKLKKKEEAVARGLNLHASKKHCMYISKFIKNKKIDDAIADLEDVTKLKRAIPFKGEIPHRKGKMMSGRYPVKTCKMFMNLLTSLKGNVIVNQMDLEKTRIYSSSPSWASRPMRRGNTEAKRTNVVIVAREIEPNKQKEGSTG